MIIKAIGLVIIIVIAGASVILFTPLFSDLRRSAAASYLSQLGDYNVKVRGDVDLDLGQTFRVTITELDLVSPGNVPEVRQHIDFFSISIPVWSALLRNFDLDSLTLQGARVAFLVEKEDGSSAKEEGAKELARFISSFLNRTISPNLSLRNVTLEFRSPDNGWKEKLVIESLALLEETNGLITINGAGKFNDSPVKLVGKFGSGRKVQSRPVNLAVSFAGSKMRIDGDIDTSKDLAAIDVTINSHTDSLGDLLAALRLKRALEGKSEMTSRVNGPINAPKLSEFHSTVTGIQGRRFELSGLVENIYRGTGIDLEFSGSLPKGTLDAKFRTGILDIEFTGFNGTLSGSWNELELDNLILQTNVASAELKDIGPISVGRITKDDEGRLGIRNIRVLNGSPESRTLDLEGDITDALQLTGISLKGQLNIAAADLFKAASSEKVKDLGRLTGRIAISDKQGALSIDDLEASVVESELIALNIAHSIADLDVNKDVVLDVHLSIPDFKAFAEALGETSIHGGRFEYSGQFALKNQRPELDGKLTMGETEVSGSLKGIIQDKKPHLIGNIGSRLLHLNDLSGLLDILGLERNKSHADIHTDLEQDLSELSAELTIKVDKIAGKDRDVGNINGRLLYNKKVLALDPLRVSYLGGAIQAKAEINSGEKVTQFSSSGSISNLPVGRLLSELGAPPLISGSITTKYSVSGSGDDAISWIMTLSGNVNTSISSGTLRTNLIDLSGLNLVTWLTTSSTKDSVNLVCAVLPFSFKNGRGSTERMVLETNNVQVVGGGRLDIKNDQVDLSFVPIPKRKQLVDIVSPFKVSGKLSRPEISVQKGTAGRVAAEVVTLPLNVLGLIVGSGKNGSAKSKPCIVPATNTNQKRSEESDSGSSSQSWKPEIFSQ